MSQSIALLEVNSLLAAIEAVDAMVKSTTVLVEGCKVMGDKVLIVISGDHKKVCASLEIGQRRAESFHVQVIKQVIAYPHAETKKVLDALLASNTSSEKK